MDKNTRNTLKRGREPSNKPKGSATKKQRLSLNQNKLIRDFIPPADIDVFHVDPNPFLNLDTGMWNGGFQKARQSEPESSIWDKHFDPLSEKTLRLFWRAFLKELPIPDNLASLINNDFLTTQKQKMREGIEKRAQVYYSELALFDKNIDETKGVGRSKTLSKLDTLKLGIMVVEIKAVFEGLREVVHKDWKYIAFHANKWLNNTDAFNARAIKNNIYEIRKLLDEIEDLKLYPYLRSFINSITKTRYPRQSPEHRQQLQKKMKEKAAENKKQLDELYKLGLKPAKKPRNIKGWVKGDISLEDPLGTTSMDHTNSNQMVEVPQQDNADFSNVPSFESAPVVPNFNTVDYALGVSQQVSNEDFEPMLLDDNWESKNIDFTDTTADPHLESIETQSEENFSPRDEAMEPFREDEAMDMGYNNGSFIDFNFGEFNDAGFQELTLFQDEMTTY